jgi:hypothetical protein
MEAITAEEAKNITAISIETLSKAIERINQIIKEAAERGCSSEEAEAPIALVPEIMRIYTCSGFVTKQNAIKDNGIIFDWHEEEPKLMVISRTSGS